MTVKIKIPDQLLEDTLVSAFEGGSNYWVKRLQVHVLIDGPKVTLAEGIMAGRIAVDVETRDDEPVPYQLSWENVQQGVAWMAEHSKRQFGLLMSGDGDAATGDVLLQATVFRQIVYS